MFKTLVHAVDGSSNFDVNVAVDSIFSVLHDPVEAATYQQEPGTFTVWEDGPANTDLLFYKGLHGAVVPVINLEWSQRLYRNKMQRGYRTEAVTDTILRHMPDYVNYICPTT
jgi:phosphoribulokinase